MDLKPYIKYKNIYVVPTFHSRLEFTKLVNKAFFQVSPDLIAVELPNNIREEVIEAVKRLPYLSLLGYADSLNPKQLNFVPIDPGDSIIESIKLGLEYNVPIEFIDLSLTDYTPQMFKLPDDYSINKIGLNLFYQKVSEIFNREDINFKKEFRDTISLDEYFENQEELEKKYDYRAKDVLREKYMATHLLKMIPLYHRILFIVGMAHWENIKYFLDNPENIEDVEIDLIPFKHLQIYNIKSSDARFLLRELPYNTYRWVKFKEKNFIDIFNKIESPEQINDLIASYDKINHIKNIFIKSKREYEEEYKEFVDLHKLKSLFQYSRNLSLTEKRLLPNLLHLLIAAKNIIDDDFGWKVYERAAKYPYDDDSNKYETMKLSAGGGFNPNGKYVKLKRRFPYSYDKDKNPLKKKPNEEYPGQWRNEWEKGKWQAVSYPPEDVQEEDYFDFIRRKAKRNLKNQRIKIEEFKSSLMDGIAIKETIRNWAFKKKIYVRNEQQLQGNIDTLIVIFDKDDGEVEKYPYKLDWWAEHDKESNLSLYSTNPGKYLIGPGISHVEIGGLLSIFPPHPHREVFQDYMDYEYRDTKNKAERLLKAGILHSKERFILYVAAEAPRKYFYSMAGVKHRELVHIPLDNFNQESLKTIKHVHILAGKDKRKIAPQYIFLND
ncbi:MAG: hypothetical protein ACFFBP_10280 [Promethearchaeota archaeon]